MAIRFIPTNVLRLFGALIVCAMVVAPDAVGAQSGILRSTYLGGVGHTDGRVVAVDPSKGDVLLAGSATVGDIPATAGGAQPDPSGPQDATSFQHKNYLTSLADPWYPLPRGKFALGASSSRI